MLCHSAQKSMEGAIISIYKGRFEPRRWLIYIRYEATVRGKRCRFITYPLSNGSRSLIGSGELQVEKRKKSGLFQYNCKNLLKTNKKRTLNPNNINVVGSEGRVKFHKIRKNINSYTNSPLS